MIEEIKSEPQEQKPEPKPLRMTITMQTDGRVEVNFTLLDNAVYSYGFLKIAEKTLDHYYKEKGKSRIEKPHNILNFARKH